MEPPQQSLEDYLDSLDPESRRRVIQREGLWPVDEWPSEDPPKALDQEAEPDA